MMMKASATLGACILALGLSGVASATAAEPLFPQPIHLTRVVDDPVSGMSATIEEYCIGDRVIAIRGERTSIADYAKGELTEIDRTNATVSVTRFDELARAWRAGERAPRLAAASLDSDAARGPGIRSLGAAIVSGRRVNRFEAEIETGGGATALVTLGLDSEILLSRDALEVLSGAAWPHPRNRERELVVAMSRDDGALRTSATNASQAPRFHLPIDETIAYEITGEVIEVTNRITRVGRETPPAEALTIPAGATRVESAIVRSRRMLDELDRLPAARPDRN